MRFEKVPWLQLVTWHPGCGCSRHNRRLGDEGKLVFNTMIKYSSGLRRGSFGLQKHMLLIRPSKLMRSIKYDEQKRHPKKICGVFFDSNTVVD